MGTEEQVNDQNFKRLVVRKAVDDYWRAEEKVQIFGSSVLRFFGSSHLMVGLRQKFSKHRHLGA